VAHIGQKIAFGLGSGFGGFFGDSELICLFFFGDILYNTFVMKYGVALLSG
jgi:hypothetical protein